MKREELNWAEYCSNRSDTRYAIKAVYDAVYDPNNWEWVNEFSVVDTDGTNYFIHFGFVFKKHYYGRQLVCSMPTDYKMKDNNELMYNRKKEFIKLFAQILMDEELNDNANLIRSEILTPYEKKPYAVGGNIE